MSMKAHPFHYCQVISIYFLLRLRAARLRPVADIFAMRFAPYFLRPIAAAIAAPFFPPPADFATAANRLPLPSLGFRFFAMLYHLTREFP